MGGSHHLRAERLTPSISLPLYPQQQTPSGHPAMSGWCQLRTLGRSCDHLVQRRRSFRYLTGITSGCPFSATKKSMALARPVVLGFLIMCTPLLGLDPKSPGFIVCAASPSGS